MGVHWDGSGGRRAADARTCRTTTSTSKETAAFIFLGGTESSPAHVGAGVDEPEEAVWAHSVPLGTKKVSPPPREQPLFIQEVADAEPGVVGSDQRNVRR